MKHENTGIKRIFVAFKNSYDGFKVAFVNEEAFRQDLLICLILLITSFFLSVSKAT